jgi:hypothetical protein
METVKCVRATRYWAPHKSDSHKSPPLMNSHALQRSGSYKSPGSSDLEPKAKGAPGLGPRESASLAWVPYLRIPTVSFYTPTWYSNSKMSADLCWSSP